MQIIFFRVLSKRRGEIKGGRDGIRPLKLGRKNSLGAFFYLKFRFEFILFERIFLFSRTARLINPAFSGG
jgi:hypothetical protein